jgi:hypothetical protein
VYHTNESHALLSNLNKFYIGKCHFILSMQEVLGWKFHAWFHLSVQREIINYYSYSLKIFLSTMSNSVDSHCIKAIRHNISTMSAYATYKALVQILGMYKSQILHIKSRKRLFNLYLNIHFYILNFENFLTTPLAFHIEVWFENRSVQYFTNCKRVFCPLTRLTNIPVSIWAIYIYIYIYIHTHIQIYWGMKLTTHLQPVLKTRNTDLYIHSPPSSWQSA